MLSWQYELDENALRQMLRLMLFSPAGRMPRYRRTLFLAGFGALLAALLCLPRPQGGRFVGTAGVRLLCALFFAGAVWRAGMAGLLFLESKALARQQRAAPKPGLHRVTASGGIYTHEGNYGAGAAESFSCGRDAVQTAISGRAGLLVVFADGCVDFIPARAFPQGETPRAGKKRLLAALAGEGNSV